MAEDGDKVKLGCQHYSRKCAFITPCCNKQYACRLCHDDNESHQVNRKSVMTIFCLVCNKKQEVGKNCYSCKTEFGRYFCPICRLYDDNDKQQFHCDGCGICRIGGRNNYYHCPKCDLCLAIHMKDDHKCVEKASRTNCAVCMEDLHTSRIPSHIPPCGHIIHFECFEGMLKSGNSACPLCSESMVKMEDAWVEIDKEIAETEMPEEYRNYLVQILCRDCHKESRVLFHVLGLKCQECGSYNTCRAVEPAAAEQVRGPNPHHELDI